MNIAFLIVETTKMISNLFYFSWFLFWQAEKGAEIRNERLITYRNMLEQEKQLYEVNYY